MKSTNEINCRRRRRLFLFLMMVSILHSVTVFAQKRTISGTVVDESNEPLIGATVVAEGKSSMTVTNMDGRFSLAVPDKAKTIEISFIGYTSQTISIKEKSIFMIRMRESDVQMDEVVVIGYGTSKRGNITGSIAKVDASKLEDRPSPNVVSSLQGQLAGVEVRTTDGTPGAAIQIRVRGAASINADATPLYVVDGIPVDDLGNLNPNDIQSIEVLKDASSSAIYGSRGANGVVLITTKTPNKDDKVRIQFTAAFSIQQLERRLDVMTPEEWIAYRTAYNNDKYVSALGGKGATANDDWDTRYALNSNRVNYEYMNDPRWTQPGYGGLSLIDWQDEYYRLAPMQNYQLAISNGRGNTQYRVSLGYTDQEGIAIETAYRRLNVRSNVETKLLDRVAVGINLSPSFEWQDGARLYGKDQQSMQAVSMCPVAEPEAGIYAGAEPYSAYQWTGSKVSPVAYMKEVTNVTEIGRLNSSAYVRANIIDGLKLQVTGAFDFISRQSRNFTPSSVVSRWTDGEGYHTSADRQDSRSYKYLFQAVMNYDKRFGKHNVSAMAGYSMETSSGSSSRLSAERFPDNSLEVFNKDDEVLKMATASLSTTNRLLSYFGRAQYEYDNRYLFTASIRRDGSSRFGKNNRWGTFPAFSAGYRISNEKFWPEKFVINQAKIRASWGMNGNNSISTDAAIGVMGSMNYASGPSLVNGFAPTSIDNPELGWEKTHSWNFGVDLGFFNNRIAMSVDYYDKTTKDLLYKVKVPATMGFTQAWGNIGSIKNKGLEVELTTQNLTGKLKWTTSFNMGYNKNEVLSLGEDNSTVFIGWSNSNTQVFMVGQPLRAYYMYDAVGVYQTQEDLKRYPTMKNSVVGDVRYRDVNDDGVIDDNDRTLVGKPTPDYTFGMTNKFQYKDFDLSILFTGQKGGMIYSILGRAIDRPGMGASYNVLSRWKNMWMSEANPGDGKTPGINNTNTSSLYDSRWLYSTDFIKLKNVTLGYKIPLRKKKVLSSARIYIAGENLLMWHKYDGGYSPETNNGGRTDDYDYGSYPQARTFTFGVNLTF